MRSDRHTFCWLRDCFAACCYHHQPVMETDLSDMQDSYLTTHARNHCMHIMNGLDHDTSWPRIPPLDMYRWDGIIARFTIHRRFRAADTPLMHERTFNTPNVISFGYDSLHQHCTVSTHPRIWWLTYEVAPSSLYGGEPTLRSLLVGT